MESIITFRSALILLISLLHCEVILANGKVTECDRLAANPYDLRKVVAGVDWDSMNYKLAIEVCKREVDEHPNIPRLQYQYARSLHRGGICDSAQKWYDQSISNGYNYGLLSVLTLFVDRKDKCFIAYDISTVRKISNLYLERTASSIQSQIQLCGSYTEHNLVKDGMKYCEVAASGGDAESIFNLAVLYQNSGNKRKSQELVRQALKAGSQSARNYFEQVRADELSARRGARQSRDDENQRIFDNAHWDQKNH